MRDELVRLAPTFVLITLVGGFFTQCYQRRAAQAALEAQQISANRVAASELHHSLSDILGRKLYLLQSGLMWRDSSLVPFTTPEQVADSRKWYESASWYRADVCRFFGPGETLHLQRLIVDMDYIEALRALEGMAVRDSSEVAGFVPYVPDARGGADSIRLRAIRKFDSLSANVYVFNLALADRIRRGDFAATEGPQCADAMFREFEQTSSKIGRLRFMFAARDTAAKRRGAMPKH
jgi:hypothetical protein